MELPYIVEIVLDVLTIFTFTPNFKRPVEINLMRKWGYDFS